MFSSKLSLIILVSQMAQLGMIQFTTSVEYCCAGTRPRFDSICYEYESDSDCESDENTDICEWQCSSSIACSGSCNSISRTSDQQERFCETMTDQVTCEDTRYVNVCEWTCSSTVILSTDDDFSDIIINNGINSNKNIINMKSIKVFLDEYRYDIILGILGISILFTVFIKFCNLWYVFFVYCIVYDYVTACTFIFFFFCKFCDFFDYFGVFMFLFFV